MLPMGVCAQSLPAPSLGAPALLAQKALSQLTQVAASIGVSRMSTESFSENWKRAHFQGLLESMPLTEKVVDASQHRLRPVQEYTGLLRSAPELLCGFLRLEERLGIEAIRGSSHGVLQDKREAAPLQIY